MDNSPLRRLSPELRNLIYEFTFAGSIVNLNKFGESVGALTQVCKKIRSESRLLLFATADIRIDRSVWAWLYPVGAPARVDILGQTLVAVFPEEVFRAISGSAVKVEGLSSVGRGSNIFFRYDCPKCNAPKLEPGAKRHAVVSLYEDAWVHSAYNAFCHAYTNRRVPRL